MATARKNLYLVSEVDLPTGEKQEKGEMKPLKRVGPGILSELDITDAEIKSLPRGVVRAATADEIEGAEQRAVAAEARQLAAEAEAERRDAEAEHEAEKRALASEIEKGKAEELAKMDAQREAERLKEAAATSAELNKVQGITTPKSSAKK